MQHFLDWNRWTDGDIIFDTLATVRDTRNGEDAGAEFPIINNNQA